MQKSGNRQTDGGPRESGAGENERNETKISSGIKTTDVMVRVTGRVENTNGLGTDSLAKMQRRQE